MRLEKIRLMMFIAFFLSFTMLWSMSDLMARMEHENRGRQEYASEKAIRIQLPEYDALLDEEGRKAADRYAASQTADLFSKINEITQGNISVSGLNFPIKYKSENVFTEIELKQNEPLPYKRTEVYGEENPLLIGETLKPYLLEGTQEGAAKSICLYEENYGVNGVLENYGTGGEDERVIILWELLHDAQKDVLTERLLNNGIDFTVGIRIGIGSNEGKTQQSFDALCEWLEGREGVLFCEVSMPHRMGACNDWYTRYHSTVGIVCVVFSVLNGIVVSNLWFQKRKREFLIRKAFGYGRWKLYLLMWREISGIAMGSLSFSVVAWVGYLVLSHKKILPDLLGLQCLMMLAGLAAVIFVTVSEPYYKIVRIDPAQGFTRFRR